MNFHNHKLHQYNYYHHYELGVWYTWRVFCWITLQRQRVSLAELDGARVCWPHVTKLRTRTDAPSASSPFFWFWVPSNLELLLSSVVTARRCYGQEEDRGMGFYMGRECLAWAGLYWHDSVPYWAYIDMISAQKRTQNEKDQFCRKLYDIILFVFFDHIIKQSKPFFFFF